MKGLLGSVLVLALAATSFFPEPVAHAAVGQVRNEEFCRTVYLATPSGDRSGRSYGNAKQLDADADLWAIDAGTQIKSVNAIVDEAVLGVTTAKIGDDDDDDAYLRELDVTSYLATPGMLLGKGLQAPGGFLSESSSVPAFQRYYRATGKEVKWDATGTLGATGKMRVVICGRRHAVD